MGSRPRPVFGDRGDAAGAVDDGQGGGADDPAERDTSTPTEGKGRIRWRGLNKRG